MKLIQVRFVQRFGIGLLFCLMLLSVKVSVSTKYYFNFTYCHSRSACISNRDSGNNITFLLYRISFRTEIQMSYISTRSESVYLFFSAKPIFVSQLQNHRRIMDSEKNVWLHWAHWHTKNITKKSNNDRLVVKSYPCGSPHHAS